jgi:hypothetical protein
MVEALQGSDNLLQQEGVCHKDRAHRTVLALKISSWLEEEIALTLKSQ